MSIGGEEEMKLVNRCVLVLKPTAKMLDWINSVGEKSNAVAPAEIIRPSSPGSGWRYHTWYLTWQGIR
jgi:hypothetical protein